MGKHEYYCKKTKRVLPSVTAIISNQLKLDYSWWDKKISSQGKDPDWERNRLGMIGTICHYRVLSKISPTPIEMPEFPVSQYPENSAHYAELVEMMWQDLRFSISRATCEKFHANIELGYCGTPDCKGLVSGSFRDKRTGKEVMIKNKKVLFDLKTSFEAKESYYYQLAAYSLFYESPPDYAMVICLCPYIEKNEYLLPRVYLLEQKELISYQNLFKKMIKSWWKEHE